MSETHEKEDARHFPKFEVSGDENTVTQRWIKWVRALQYKIDASGITKNERKRAMLLHYAGLEVQEIWATLEETVESEGIPPGGNVFTACVNALTEFFKPVLNYAFERREFHALRPRPSESTTQFCTRLQTKIGNCDFERPDREVADMLVSYCQNESIAKELLKLKAEEFTLNKVREVIRLHETISMQAKTIVTTLSAPDAQEMPNKEEGEVTTVSYVRSGGQNGRCWRCDGHGHFGRDPRCPARNRECTSCGLVGHYAAVCRQGAVGGDQHRGARSQRGQQHARSTPSRGPRHGQQGTYRNRDGQGQVKFLTQVDGESNLYRLTDSELGFDEDNNTFLLRDGVVGQCDDSWVTIRVGGVYTQLYVDNGTRRNVLDTATLRHLINSKASVVIKKCAHVLYPYVSPPVTARALLQTEITYRDKVLPVEFLIVEGPGPSLLGKATAKLLGLLLVGSDCSDLLEELHHGTPPGQPRESAKSPQLTTRRVEPATTETTLCQHSETSAVHKDKVEVVVQADVHTECTSLLYNDLFTATGDKHHSEATNLVINQTDDIICNYKNVSSHYSIVAENVPDNDKNVISDAFDLSTKVNLDVQETNVPDNTRMIQSEPRVDVRHTKSLLRCEPSPMLRPDMLPDEPRAAVVLRSKQEQLADPRDHSLGHPTLATTDNLSTALCSSGHLIFIYAVLSLLLKSYIEVALKFVAKRATAAKRSRGPGEGGASDSDYFIFLPKPPDTPAEADAQPPADPGWPLHKS